TNGSLFFEVTSAPRSPVLLVFVPASVAVALGRSSPAASRSRLDGAVAYEHDADLEVEENAAENYADSEWSYEHGNESGYNPAADESATEVFSPVDPDGGQGGGGAHRADK
ncbi:hypothetical protein GS498_23825, partial [Rhodococcus hoagii]|nr:hypothetical protein [Prescottella equi]